MNKELNLGNQISKYYKSFSGTDTLAFIMLPGASPVVIGSLTTISYSMYRNKKPVINIGRTNINGVTRGSRIFAGTMIFTLINQHWLKELQQQGGTWLSNYGYTNENGEWIPDDSYELRVDEMPLFDIMIVSANEYGNSVIMYIYGIDFTDEAQTISVEDLFTENTFSFIARDVSNFKAFNTAVSKVYKGGVSQKYNKESQRFYVLDSSQTSLDDIEKLEQESYKASIEQSKKESKHHTLQRELYYSSSRLMMGNDVAMIQELLNETKLMSIEVSGIFDKATDEAVRKYQLYIKDGIIDGIVDDKVYNSLLNHVSGNKVYGLVVNKHGAIVYKDTDFNSDIVDSKLYHEQVAIQELVTSDNNGIFQKWYKTGTGYIAEEDLYSSYYTGNVIEFPTIEFGDSGAYVTLIQSALADIYEGYYEDCNEITGTYGHETETIIKKLQEENGLYPSGIVDYDTWILLQSLSGNITNQISNDNFEIEFQTPPGIYSVSTNDVLDKISLFKTKASCDNYINIKFSAICIYDDNNSETLSQTIPVKDEQIISLNELKNAFVFNPKYGKIPKQIDYIVYPYNKKPFKWTILYS